MLRSSSELVSNCEPWLFPFQFSLCDCLGSEAKLIGSRSFLSFRSALEKKYNVVDFYAATTATLVTKPNPNLAICRPFGLDVTKKHIVIGAHPLDENDRSLFPSRVHRHLQNGPTTRKTFVAFEFMHSNWSTKPMRGPGSSRMQSGRSASEIETSWLSPSHLSQPTPSGPLDFPPRAWLAGTTSDCHLRITPRYITTSQLELQKDPSAIAQYKNLGAFPDEFDRFRFSLRILRDANTHRGLHRPAARSPNRIGSAIL
jgi:hypothetical protein